MRSIDVCSGSRAHRTSLVCSLAFAASAAFTSTGCAHKRPAPAPQIFHYRALAHPMVVGDQWTAQLNGDTSDKFADAIRFHFDQIGVLKLSAVSPSPKVAVLVFTAGKKALVQARVGKPLETPPINGDVFVVVRALKGTGPIAVQLASQFELSAPGTPPAPPTGPPELELAPGPQQIDPNTIPLDDPNALPLDDLLSN